MDTGSYAVMASSANGNSAAAAVATPDASTVVTEASLLAHAIADPAITCPF